MSAQLEFFIWKRYNTSKDIAVVELKKRIIMKIKKNAFEKNGRIMMTVLASFLTLIAVSTVACTKEEAKKRNRVSKM